MALETEHGASLIWNILWYVRTNIGDATSKLQHHSADLHYEGDDVVRVLEEDEAAQVACDMSLTMNTEQA